MNLNERLLKIQSELKAPKNQFNKFGNYKYRSCEDILEAVKPLLLKYECTLTISDEVKEACGVPYICSLITIKNLEDTEMCIGCAGIDVNKKGMDYAQSFGASSSYARKYALNGLFLIDDTKDADATNTHGKEAKKVASISDENVASSIEKGKQSDLLEAIEKGKYTATPDQLLKLKEIVILSVNNDCDATEIDIEK